MDHDVTVIGAGLAGCEVAWALAAAGLQVRLCEMKPLRRTAAQRTDAPAELVCSNSLRSAHVHNAVGLLKQEMQALGSLVVGCAHATRVPAGDALAVDRERFATAISAALREHPRITVQAKVVATLPPASSGPVVVATGPLTDAALADDLARHTGAARLYFYDAIAPIVAGDSIDRTVAFAASRYGKGDGADYLNCPLDRAQYETFVAALLAAECMPLHAFEEAKYFQGCLPVEVVAERGAEALRFGCMKPVGLTDPRTGRWPYAVVQLRQEDVHGQAYNLVGFQTKMKHPEQRRVLRLIPGLQGAEFVRLGAIHRNTFVDSPALLDDRMRLRGSAHVRLAGQLTGVEGYVESAAHGLLVGLHLAAELRGHDLDPPPAESALGALWGHVRGAHRLPGRPHEPQNINWSMFPPPAPGTRKTEVKAARVQRATHAFATWLPAAQAVIGSSAAQVPTPLAG